MVTKNRYFADPAVGVMISLALRKESPMRVKLIFIIFFLLVSTPALWAEDAKNYISKGNQFVKTQDYKNAAKEYEEALKVDPENAYATLLLGMTYANLKDYDKALQYAEKAVKLQPGFTAYYNLGLIYANKNETKKALQALDQALAANPASYQAHYQKGALYSSQKEYAKAIESYQQSIKLNPQYDKALLGLAGAYYFQGDKATAQKQVEELRKIGQKQEADGLEVWINEREKLSAKGSTIPANEPPS